MKLRTAVMALAVAAALIACDEQPTSTSTPSYQAAPEYCPYDERTVQFNGDSVGAHVGARLALPEYSVFNAAQGGAGWVFDDVVATIPSRVRQWIQQCGVPGVVVVEGGINDLTHAVAVSEMQDEVRALSDWLEAREVPTIWVAVQPMAADSAYWFVQERRVEYNQWLLGTGELWGTAVDCTSALEDPSEPDALRSEFFTYLDIWGTVDGIHMNDAGYTAMARCLEPEIRAVMTGTATPDGEPSP